MSSTGQPTAIELPTFGQRSSARSWLPAALIWGIVLISFRPFQSEVSSEVSRGGGGDFVNQVGFGLLGLFCIWLLSTKADRSVLAAFKTPAILVACLVLIMSVANADEPVDASRAMIFSIIVVLCAATAMTVLASTDDFVTALTASAGASLAFCYIAVFFFPDQGVHGGGGYEAQHAGLWRGIYDHKNVASYIMGGFSIIGFFVMRCGRPAAGLTILCLAAFFVVQAGSKTVLGILPAAFLTAGIARWVTPPFLRLCVIVVPILLLFGATLGAVLHPPILDWLKEFVPGLSYTGRTDLWIFGLENLQKAPWLGYGFESFWNTPRVTGLEQPIELSWDVRGIVHGHNSWLDTMLAFGVPGALLLFLPIAIVPVRDYLQIPDHGNAARLGTLFIAIFVFTALGACLESFFVRRSDPVWFLMLISIVGLRVTAHMSCASKVTGRP